MWVWGAEPGLLQGQLALLTAELSPTLTLALSLEQSLEHDSALISVSDPGRCTVNVHWALDFEQ